MDSCLAPFYLKNISTLLVYVMDKTYFAMIYLSLEPETQSS